ncbi:hypothetical protein ACGFIF_41805 [Kribbella sp. NPDC049174]|uniref:hypothetical protein n=1 Tax=Kribbella sp. NPDC049174 TaxID=3364112 RepID=UPI003723E26F
MQPVLEAYAAFAAVDAVMLGGSTARGDSDRWSDTEVGVFWSRPPTVEERAAIVPAAHAADIRLVSGADANPPWYDHVYLGAERPYGLMVEVVHTPTSVVEATLDTVLGSCQPDGPGLDAIKGIVEGRDVTGARADLVAGWQARAATYPRGLAIAVVQRDGAIEQFWRWRMHVDRDNPLLLAREFMRVSSQMLNVLHALNGRYCGHPSAFKRLDALEHDLTIAPPALATRLRSVFSQPAPEGAAILRTLVEETYNLVEAHLPEVDVDRLRTLFRSDRHPLDTPPPAAHSAQTIPTPAPDPD